MRGELVALDLETTGLSIERDHIIEIGAVRLVDGVIVDEYGTLINPEVAIPQETTYITGIEQADLRNAPTLRSIMPDLETFVGSAPVIAHNVAFDLGFMRRFGLLANNRPVDTVDLASILLPRQPRYSLGTLTKLLDIQLEHAHRALDDARATALLYSHLWKMMTDLPTSLLREICAFNPSLDWPLRFVFEAALREKGSAKVGEEPAEFPLLSQPAEALPTLKPNPQVVPIESETTDFYLSADGELARTLSQFEHREQQQQMAQEIAASFNSNRHRIIEAATGTGKSIAYLLPAILWATQNNQPVVISTNTINLQDQLINKDVPILKVVLGDEFRVAVMKGRANYLCPRRLAASRRRQPTSVEELHTLAKVLIWLNDNGSGDRSEINLRGVENAIWTRLSAQDEGCTLHRCQATMAGVCPFYRARKQAESAHVVIVNHALLVSDATSEKHVLPDYSYLIVDEAHQLEEAVTRGMSLRVDQVTLLRRLAELGGVNSGALGDLLRSARNHIPDKEVIRLETFIQDVGMAIQAMGTVIKRFFEGLQDFINDANLQHEHQALIDSSRRAHSAFSRVAMRWQSLSEYFDVIADALDHLSQTVQGWEEYHVPGLDDHIHSASAAARYLQEVYRLLQSFTHSPDPNSIYWIGNAQNPEYISVQAAPLHVGPLIEKALWQTKRSIILTSATLRTGGSFGYLQDRLYADDMTTTVLSSPFDYPKAALVYVPDDIPEPKHHGYQRIVERGIVELATALNGRVMVLFTSYAQLKETAGAIGPRLALGNIIVLDQATGGSRDTLLDTFKSTEKAVLLGTRSFWEGVDIPGDDLSALIIVRLPFTVPSEPVFAARSETYQDPFHQYAVPNAILRFRQGFGRLIRSRTDKGIVAIFDSRVINKRYGAQFLESLPDCTIQTGPMERLAPTAAQWLGLTAPPH